MDGPGENYSARVLPGAPTGNIDFLPSFRITAFGHISDLHIVDDQSPARVEFLDRFANTDEHPDPYPTGSAYRPQEAMSTQITDAMVRALRNIGRGPLTRIPLKFTIVTGDAVDNAQFNETRWYIDLLDGGKTILPDSGFIGRDQSVSGVALTAEASYWHPDLTAATPHNTYNLAGFAAMPGLLAAARRPFTSTGLGMPWYAAYGNHDVMVQGNLSVGTTVPINAQSIAVGNSKMLGVNTQLPVNFKDAGVFTAVDVFTSGVTNTRVTADPNRRLMSTSDFVNEHFKTSGTPVGHGFDPNNGGKFAFYTIPSADSDMVQYITLDSTNSDGDLLSIDKAASGCIDNFQWQWLQNVLIKNSSRYWDGGKIVHQSGVKDKLFVIFCHHTISTMTNLIPKSGSTTNPIPQNPKHSGTELASLLLNFPNVVLMANGHTHRNEVVSHARPSTSPLGAGGFWEVSAASHIDWPVQSRIIEIATSGENVMIFSNTVDLDAPLSSGGDTSTPMALASLARELAVNDVQERDSTRRGDIDDRNVQLLVPMPFKLPALKVLYQSAATNQLYRGDQNSGSGVLAGTSTSVTTRTDGTWQCTFISPDNVVWTQNVNGGSPAGPATMPRPAAGTSPTITATTDGGYTIAFVAEKTLSLWVIDQNGNARDTVNFVLPNTSPTIAPLPNGGWRAAFTSWDGWLTAADAGSSARVAPGLQPAPGTNPAIATDTAGNFKIAVCGNGSNRLVTVTNTGTVVDTGKTMKAGTSPAITHLPTGGYQAVYHGTDDFLYEVGDAATRRTEGGLLVADNTSPVIHALPTGGYMIAINARGGNLWLVGPDNIGTPYTTTTLAPRTNPALTH
ncbi:TIGR03767 family metallophosphoesterase [Streptomyces sp. RKAG293]|nr:TIGR03767 family metallophosphoesterase [Streptomyces sp. RKAG293]